MSHAPVRAPPLLLASAVSPATHAECTASNAKLATSTTQGDPKARAAAQKGLDYLAHAARQWQDEHQCYGCHVQAVTLEAMTVGKSHQYTVKAEDLNAIVFGMTDISGGVHGPHGLTVGNEVYLPETSKSFGGSAFAHFDERVGPKLRKELEQTATELLAAQNTDGSVRASYNNAPIVIGEIQSTAQALTTWRQVFARTADTRWLVPIRKSEEWLTVQAKRLSDGGGPLQDVDHAIIGLHAAGRESGDKLVTALGRVVEKMQNSDGGFGYNKGEPSNAFATGQALYALRLAGHSDGDTGIKKGTSWLLQQQQADGGWGGSGFGKAEAMWAVLGLVSIDVLSLSVGGIEDGQHVSGDLALRVRAKDNAGRGVERVEIAVDDIPVHRACGDAADYRIDTAKLESGAHLVDVTAVNARGQTSRRRYEVYAGAHYLTQVATRFTDGGTMVSLRDVAPASTRGEVALRIFATRDEGGRSVRGAEVHHESRPSAEGPMSFFWKGEDQHGRFIAEVSFVDAGKKAVQAVQVPFVHDTLDAQRAKFGEVEGTLSVDGAAPAANTKVELVDDQGRVVQSTVTTNEGNYRFRNVDGGKYKVRVSRQGFQAAEAEVHARAAAPAAAAPKMDLQRR